ncbi:MULTISPECIES: hypothetical protein [unclassified Caballeronia]|uniref:hypothetical protein n=1 Tax=unclassified Caballeronia TaxID=2646786 RepID=UPI00286728CB|nr:MULTISPECIES: hypothetical protein [unclassified Caballeronia]MDR5751912.1 hypothetical protein [Caballeronia sp. LZ024]MDR5843947.1 hypothetical protein [Caballeronia sp. LZ031]
MKQRHIQSFLMVSAAFFAMNAPIRGGNATSHVNASPAQQVAQMRAQIADARSTRQDASQADDEAQD